MIEPDKEPTDELLRRLGDVARELPPERRTRFDEWREATGVPTEEETDAHEEEDHGGEDDEARAGSPPEGHPA